MSQTMCPIFLVEFAHIDQITRIKNQQGQDVEAVVDLLYEAESLNQTPSIDREREVHRHIGDLTLFMAGLFPEYLSHIKCSGLIHHKDFLVDYVKAWANDPYGIVATYPEPESKEPPTLFQTPLCQL